MPSLLALVCRVPLTVNGDHRKIAHFVRWLVQYAAPRPDVDKRRFAERAMIWKSAKRGFNRIRAECCFAMQAPVPHSSYITAGEGAGA